MFVPVRGLAPVQAAPTTPSPEPENSGRFEWPLVASTGKLESTTVAVGTCACADQGRPSASDSTSAANVNARIVTTRRRLDRTVDMGASLPYVTIRAGTLACAQLRYKGSAARAPAQASTAGRSARKARPRWEAASLVAGSTSALVSSQPSGTNTGS